MTYRSNQVLHSPEPLLESGSLHVSILTYAIPIALTGMLQQLFTACDVAVVGRFAGDEAMAAVGSNGPLVNLIVNLVLGMALGTNVMVAQAIGRGDNEKIKRTVHTSIIFSVIAGLVLAVISQVFARQILILSSVPENVLEMATTYLAIYLAGMPAILLYNFISAIFRSKGDTRTPLVVLTIAGFINITLNIIFVKFFNMAAGGVALATVISNLFSGLVLIYLSTKVNDATRLSRKDLKVSPDELKEMIAIGVPAGLQGCMFSISNIIIQSAINSLGSTIMAAAAVAVNIESFAFFIMSSFGQATTTFTGKFYGAGLPKKCRQTLRIGIAFSEIAIISTIVLTFVFGKSIVSLFNDNPEVISLAYHRLTILIFGYIFSCINENSSGYMRGFGLSLYPAIISVCCICFVRIVWVHTVFAMYPNFDTICIIYPTTLALSGIVTLCTALIYKPSKRLIAQGE